MFEKKPSDVRTRAIEKVIDLYNESGNFVSLGFIRYLFKDIVENIRHVE